MLATTTVRIPEDVHGRVRVVAAVTGTTPGDLLSAAFTEYFEHHREDIARRFQQAQKMVFDEKVDAILEMTKPARSRRAASAAQGARRGSTEGK